MSKDKLVENDLEEKLLGGGTKRKEYDRYKSIYPFTALLAGFCIGINNFLNSTMVSWVMDIRILYPTCIGQIVLFCSYHLYTGLNLYADKGHFWSKEDSKYLISGKDINKSNVMAMIFRYITSFGSFILIYYIMKTAIES